MVCDRYVHSSLAYQGIDNDIGWIAAMNAPMRRPDLTILVHVTPEVAAHRRGDRGETAERFEVDELQRLVYRGYLSATEMRPDDPWVRIDGEQDVETVHRSICSVVDELLSRKGIP